MNAITFKPQINDSIINNYEAVSAASTLLVNYLMINRIDFIIEYSKHSESIYFEIKNKNIYEEFVDPIFRVSCHYNNFENEYNQLIISTDKWFEETNNFIDKVFIK